MSANVRSLRDACNLIGAKSTNPEATQRLQSLSNDALRSMGELIQRGADWSDEGRRATMIHAQSVNTNIDSLVSYLASTNEFGGEPARISREAREVEVFYDRISVF